MKLYQGTVYAIPLIFVLILIPSFSLAETQVFRPDPSSGYYLLSDFDMITDWSMARNYPYTIIREPQAEVEFNQVRSDKNSGFYRIVRASIPFDISSLPPDAEILSATLGLRKFSAGNSGNSKIYIVEHDRFSPTLPRKEDWNITNFSQEAISDPQELIDGDYTEFNFDNSFNQKFAEQNWVILGIMTEFDFEDRDPGSIKREVSWYRYNELLLDKGPYLEITYSSVLELSEPINIEQIRVDSKTPIADGAFFTGNHIVFSGEIGVGDETDMRALEVEVKQMSEDFDETGTYVSEYTSESTASVVVSDLIDNSDLYSGNNEADFKWRARTRDEEGNVSEWVEFGNDETDFTLVAVPLVTQVSSPYPSEETTSQWADTSYAGGRANEAGSCGATIEACGCVLSSLSTLAYHSGVVTGIDGSEVNPINLNDWLLANNGFTGDGSILWPEAMKYFGRQTGPSVYKTYFSKEGHNHTDTARIEALLSTGQPVVAYARPSGWGHYFVIDSLLDTGFETSDPFWFNTTFSGQTQDYSRHIQNYNDAFEYAQLITTHEELAAFQPTIEVHLASPGELVVRNQDGERVGFDPKKEEFFSEIPGAQYDLEEGVYAGNDERSDDPHQRKVVRIFDAPFGDYTVDVIGTDTGPYLLSIYTIDEFGNSTLVEYDGEISANRVKKYPFTFGEGDSNKGHGNDVDGCDEDNGGESRRCAQESDLASA